MVGFVPDLAVTVPVSARGSEVFYEDVVAPTKLRGGLLVLTRDEEESGSGMDFQVLDPLGKVVWEEVGKSEALFHITTQEVGTYKFVVSNSDFLTEKRVTFAIGKGHDADLIGEEHLDTVDGLVKAITARAKDIQLEATYLWKRHKSHMKVTEGIHKRLLSLCSIEFLVFAAVSGVQVFYVKGLLSDRRVL